MNGQCARNMDPAFRQSTTLQILDNEIYNLCTNSPDLNLFLSVKNRTQFIYTTNGTSNKIIYLEQTDLTAICAFLWGYAVYELEPS